MNYRIVIVNYCKTQPLRRLLDQLGCQTLLPADVCVVDNSPVHAAAPRDICESAPFPIQLHLTPENLGYAKACNLGAQGGDWDWVVLLNPDIEVDSVDFFASLIERCRHVPQLGCAGVAQRNPDGSYELVARRFPTIRAILGKRIPFLGKWLFKQDVGAYLEAYANAYEKDVAPFPVDWLQSSFLLIPRHAWKMCHGLSERYFVFMADTDFGLRCQEQGLGSWFFPGFEIHADGIRSSHGGIMDIFRKRTIRIHLADAAKYFLAGLRKSSGHA